MSKQIGYMASMITGSRPIYYKEATDYTKAGIFWVGHDGDNYWRFFGEDEEFQNVEDYMNYGIENGWFIKEECELE